MGWARKSDSHFDERSWSLAELQQGSWHVLQLRVSSVRAWVRIVRKGRHTFVEHGHGRVAIRLPGAVLVVEPVAQELVQLVASEAGGEAAFGSPEAPEFLRSCLWTVTT